MIKKIYAMGICALLVSSALSARLNFGSPHSGFILAGGTLDVGDADLSGGMIRDLDGTSFIASGADCTNMTLEIADEDTAELRSMKITGVVVPGSSVTIGEGEKLIVSGARFLEGINVEGNAVAPSILEGYTELDNSIEVANDSVLVLRWNCQLNQWIIMNATNAATEEIVDDVPVINPADTCEVRLQQNLEFSPVTFFSVVGNGDCTVDCNGYKILMGGQSDDWLLIEGNLTIINPHLHLFGPVILADSIALILAGGRIDGGGNRFIFGGSNSSLNSNGLTVSLSNLLCEDVSFNSFSGDGSFDFIQCRLSSKDDEWTIAEGVSLDLVKSTFDITATLASDSSTLFTGDAVLSQASNDEFIISFHTDLDVYGEWRFDGVPTIRGNGNTIRLMTVEQDVDGVPTLFKQGVFSIGSVGLRFEDVTLANMKSVSFDTQSDGNLLYLQDVHWISSDTTHLFITGLTDQAAEVHIRPNSTTAGDIFGDELSFENEVAFELHSDVALNATWYFEDNAVFDGRGATLDMQTASFAIATDKRLILRNMTLKAADSSFEWAEGYYGVIEFSNVIVVIDEDVTWNNIMEVSGSFTAVTGNNTLSATDMSILNGTAYYDTLDSVDADNLAVASGRVMSINPEATGTIIVNSDTDIDKNEYLFPDQEGINGRMIHCIISGSLNGNGRTVFCPYSPELATVITVDAGQSLTLTNMIIDGLIPAKHLSLAGNLYFGNTTLVRLNQDVTLNGTLQFCADDIETSGESAVLDLQGHTLDISTGSIRVIGGAADANQLTICNGRLISASSDSIVVDEGNNLILQDVELVLAGSDLIYESGRLSFEGQCRISGTEGAAFIITSADDVSINDAAHLTIADGIVLSHSTTASFDLMSATSTLELAGGTFRHPDSVYDETGELVDADYLYLGPGRLICDHKSQIQPGFGGIWLIQNSLNMEFRPGATLTVTSYSQEGDQDTTTGTLVYRPY
jgi:hypothetical protein